MKKIIILLFVLTIVFIFASCNPQNDNNISSVSINKTSSTVSNDIIGNSSIVPEVETESEIVSVSANSSEYSEGPTSEGLTSEGLTSEGLTSEGLTSGVVERAKRLIKALQNSNSKEIRFYSTFGTTLGRVGFQDFSKRAENLQPNNIIDGKDAIKQFITELKLDKWEAKRFNMRSLPKAIIYISEDLHINLEAQSGGVSWMSINSSEDANAYFVVPNDVYDNTLRYIEYDKTPQNAIGYYTELTSTEKAKAKELINDVRCADISKLHAYDASTFGIGFLPLQKVGVIQEGKAIDDKAEIDKIIKDMQFEKWQARRFNLKTFPKVAIYLSESLHINLEIQSGGLSWMSINSENCASIYYVVPDEVYENLLGYFK